MLICDTHILLTSRQHEIEGRRSVVSANNNTQPCADLLGTLLSHTLEREAKQIGKRRRAIRAPREVKRPTVEFPPTLLATWRLALTGLAELDRLPEDPWPPRIDQNCYLTFEVLRSFSIRRLAIGREVVWHERRLGVEVAYTTYNKVIVLHEAYKFTNFKERKRCKMKIYERKGAQSLNNVGTRGILERSKKRRVWKSRRR